MSFFPPINSFWTPRVLPGAISHLVALVYGIDRSKFTEWVKEFIPECLDNMPLKKLSPLMKNLENWGIKPILILMMSFI